MTEESQEPGDSNKGKEDESSQDETESQEASGVESEADDDDEEEDEDDEPKLKYARLTSHLGSVYRNGDATSAFLVGGDKMVGLGAVDSTLRAKCLTVYRNA